MPRTLQKAQKIKEIFPLTNGLFAHMNYTFRAEVTKGNLDLQFLANYGKRNPSPIVEMVQDEYGETLTDSELTTLAGVVLEMYKEKWDKLGDIYDIQYDPIHNYLDEWEDTSDITGTHSIDRDITDNNVHGHNINETVNLTDTTHSEGSVTEDNTRTRTDDLTKTETRDLSTSNTVTDDLSEATTFGKTNTRTDNLTEETEYGKTETRTDNLETEVEYGKVSTREDELTEENQYGKVNTRQDNLTHTINGTETTTPNTTDTKSLYPFNSASAMPTDVNTQTGTTTLSFGNRNNTDTGTQTDTLSGTDTKSNTGTQTDTLSGTDTTSNTGTQTNVGSGSDTTTNTGTEVNASSGTNTTLNTGTRTTANEDTGTVVTADEGTETTVDDKSLTSENDGTKTRVGSTVTGHSGTDRYTRDFVESGSTTNERERAGFHRGNIGNLTSQKMILEEINLWKWNYVNEILSDVKEFCTLPVYLHSTEWQLVDQE